MKSINLSSSDNGHTLKLLFDEFFHPLVLSSFRYVNDYKQAEDIVQDVFVKLWQNFDDLKQISDLKAYLFKAVKNSSLNYLRHSKVKQKFVADSEHWQETITISTEDCKVEEETANKLHQAVNKLPEHWKEAFVMSKYDHLKYQEIAQKMNISQKTVEKYISKSLQFLRQELKDLLLLGIFVFEFLLKK